MQTAEEGALPQTLPEKRFAVINHQLTPRHLLLIFLVEVVELVVVIFEILKGTPCQKSRGDFGMKLTGGKYQ